MGRERVGKTSIISQFLYDQFSTKYKVLTRLSRLSRIQAYTERDTVERLLLSSVDLLLKIEK